MTKEQAAFELYIWQTNKYATNFHAMLFDLISKADAGNKHRLKLGFPEEVEVFLEWYNSPDPTSFFRRYNLDYTQHQVL